MQLCTIFLIGEVDILKAKNAAMIIGTGAAVLGASALINSAMKKPQVKNMVKKTAKNAINDIQDMMH